MTYKSVRFTRPPRDTGKLPVNWLDDSILKAWRVQPRTVKFLENLRNKAELS